MTVGSILQRVARILSRAGLPQARLDAELLVAHVLDISRVRVLTHPEAPFPGAAVHALARAVRQRRRGYPLQYLLGRQEFYGRSFRVTPAVLIPRPETELLVERALAALRSMGDPPWLGLDLGTGSGCIAISMALEEPRLQMVAIDHSADAIEVANDNARRLEATDNTHFILADLLSSVREAPHFDVIVSNPPYVSPSDRDTVEFSVREYEPADAVFAPPDGLAVYRRMLNGASTRLTARGRLLLELGYDVEAAVTDLARSRGWEIVDARRDLAGIVRCLELRPAPMPPSLGA